MTMARIRNLFIYPVKGLRGIGVDEAMAGVLGFEGDRTWMLMRSDGRFLTQRELPRMATLRTEYKGGLLRLHCAGMDALDVAGPPADAPVTTIRVWADDCEVMDAGHDAAAWLDAALGAPWPCRLVRMRPGFRRKLVREAQMGQGTSTQFADAAPYLIVNASSLEALNQQLRRQGSSSVAVERFRPNLVVEGLSAFAEQRTAGLHSMHGMFRLCYPCERCVVITIDQQTGVPDRQHNEPLLTLRSLNCSPDAARKPLFGMNAVWHGALAPIAVGDELRIETSNV